MNENIKILLVEDNPGDALLIKEALKDSSFSHADLLVAETLKEALTFSEENILLVLLDLGLPDSDGMDTVKNMHEYFSDCAIIVLTGLDDETVAVETLREGAQNFLTKSEVSGRMLNRAIRYSLERHEILQKLKAVDKELSRSKFLLEKAQEVSHMGSWTANLIKETAEWTDETQRIFGMKPGEFDGKSSTFFQMVHPEDVALINKEIENSAREKRLFDITHRIVRRNGERRWVHSTAEIIFNKAGQPANLIGSIQDITETKEAEEKLIKANRLYAFTSAINQSIVHVQDEKILFDTASNIAIEIGQFKTAWIGLIDENGLLNMVSLYGDEVIANEIKKFSGKDFSNPEWVNTVTAKALNTGKYAVINNFQNEAYTKSNLEIFAQLGIRSTISLPIKRFGKTIGVFGFQSDKENYFDEVEIALLEEAASDISFALENFEKERNRLRSEANLRTIFDNTTTGYVLFDNFFYIVSFNQHAQKFAEEDLHKKLTEGAYAISYYPEWQQSAAKEAMQKALKSKMINTEASYAQVDGSLRWYDVNFFPVADKNEKVYGIVMALNDITARKKTDKEREKLLTDLTHRYNELMQFNYIVSHNLRAPLANIIGLTNLFNLESRIEEKEKTNSYIQETALKMDEVIHDLSSILALKTTLNENREMINLKKIIGSIQETLLMQINSAKATIKTSIADDANSFVSIKAYIESVLYNLINNAIKYSSPNRNPVIKIEVVKTENQIIIKVSDNGIGINLELHRDKVFGLYSRFNSVKEGKGLGLYMTKTQVESIGGEIELESKPDVGSTFTVKLKAE